MRKSKLTHLLGIKQITKSDIDLIFHTTNNFKTINDLSASANRVRRFKINLQMGRLPK